MTSRLFCRSEQDDPKIYRKLQKPKNSQNNFEKVEGLLLPFAYLYVLCTVFLQESKLQKRKCY